MVGQRRCKRCLCVWEPPWSRFTLVSLFVLCGIALACGVWITCVRFPDYLSGEAFREAANAGTPKEFLYPFVGPIMLVMFWLGLKKALAVARGKAGRGHILEGGILTKGDDHNNNG